jgi:hypothetical protein
MAAEIHQKIELDETFNFSGKLKSRIFLIGGIGVLLLAIGLISSLFFGGDHHNEGHAAIIQAQDIAFQEPGAHIEADHHEEGEHHGSSPLLVRVFADLWINNLFFTGLSLVGLFFFAIQYVANAGWSIQLLRPMIALNRFMPIGGVLMLVVWLLASHDLFHWTHESLYDVNSPDYDAIIAGKAPFLNTPFYLGRMIFFFLVWGFFAFAIKKLHYEEDTYGSIDQPYYFKKIQQMCVGFLIFFGVSSSISAWDWIMSIDTHWFSTMFGWYVFASWFVSGLAMITLTLIILKEMGYLQMVSENHLHDMGKFVFGFSIFWAYIWFSQFLLIYYANIPEETIYFWERLQNPFYKTILLGNLFMNFAFPFLALMTRDAKRKNLLLKIVCIVVLVGHWFDFYIMVTPGTQGHNGTFGLLEIGISLIYLSVFLFMAFSGLNGKALVAKNHPMLLESVNHHT